MRVLIIGGTGSFSSRVTEKAFARGHEVMVYARGQRPLLSVPLAAHRGEPGVLLLRGERSELRARAAELEEFSPDVVVDSICFAPERAEDLVALFARARRLVLVSSVDVYGEDVGAAPVTEERAPSPVTPYAKGKLASEKVVLEGLGARVTVIRPSHILGRTFLTASLWGRSPYLVDRLKRGKPIPAIDGGRNVLTPVHAVDVAEWVVRSFDAPEADGEIFNAVGGEIITQRRYYECIAKALGVELQLVAVPSHVFRRHSNAASQFNWHRPYSCAKAVRVFGYSPRGTPELMLAETVEYMLQCGLVKDSAEHPFDDELVALLLGHERALGELLASRGA